MKMPSALVWVRIFLLGGCLHLGASAQQRSSSAFTHDGSPFTRLYTVAVSAPLPTEETTISSDDQPLWRPWEGLTGTSVKTPIVQQQDTAKPTGSQITVAPHTGAPLTAPDFTIKKHPDYPWAILHIFAPKEPFRLGYLEFRVNYTDLTTTDGSIPPGSYVINSESNDAFSVYGMHPGHDYKIVIVGKPIDQSKDWAILRTEHVTMDTVVPDFNGANASIEATMDSITLRAMKTPSALQDYFQIEYARLDPFLRYTPLTVTDIPEQRSIELYLGNLSPGRNYNISVTAVRGDLFSKPWQEIITTKPLMPRDIRMNDLHSTTVILEWKEPLQSGVDRYKVAYGPVNENSTLVKVNDIRETNVQLSEGLFPGKKFVFAVYSEKGAQVSDAATLEQTIKPLAPTDLQITPDFGQHMFRVDLMVPGSGASKSDSCGIELVSDVVEKIVLTSSVTTLADAARRRCTFLLALVPGRRYEMLAWTISENTTSNKLSNNTALRPAFSLKALGLELRHSERDNGVELHWPEGESAVAELNEIWGKLVGNDSLLHLRVDPVTQPTKWVEQSKQLEGSPAHRQPIKVSDLRRGACYKVQIYTVTKSGIVSANRTEEFMRIEPPSGNFSLQEVTRTSANLNIDLMTSSADLPDCNVRFKATDANGSVVNERTMPLASRAIPITLGNLTPYQKYICRADIVCGSPNDKADKECPVKVRSIAEYRFETNQDRPGPITNLTVTTINPFTVRLAWREPMDPNGRIIRYIVTVYPQDGLEAQWNVTVMAHEGGVSGQSIEAIVDKLVGGLTYQFDVRAMTEAGLGKPARAGFLNSEEAYKDGGPFTVKMPIWAPPKPQGTLEVLMNTVRVSDLTIRFSTELFSTRHGLLEKYAVIVVEVAATDSDFSTVFVDDLTNRTSTWGQVSRLPVWPAYVALESPIEHAKDFVPARTITEVIGVDERCAIDHLDVVCNGPLRPGRAYRIKIRLYTTPLLWTDSAYSELVVTEHVAADAGRTVLLVVFSVLLLLGVCACLLLLVGRRRKHHNRHSSGHSSSDSDASASWWRSVTMLMAERTADCLAKLGLDGEGNGSNGLSPNGFGHHRRSRSLRERTGVDARLERLPSGPPPGHRLNAAPLFTVIPGVNLEQSRPVHATDFAEHVRLMSADSDFRFSEEYEDLKQVGRSQTCISADLPVNRAKNRFTNILPYDHSRVKLVPVDDEDGTDYINASYIPGFNSPREFIAAQGPLPSTRDHFWRMVWEQQCPAVVALTKCVEKGRDKCHQYWPDRSELSLTYADIEVTMMNETTYDEFVVREFRLTHLSEAGTPSRTVKHLHYMSWPDFGVPEKASGLVHFARVFRQKVPPSKTCKPTVVHCSAGVGRSGTFIALDRLMQTIPTAEPFDIFGIVYGMRKERVCMVQTEQQYIFIHHCLLYVLEGRENDTGYPPHSQYPKPVPPPVIGQSGLPAPPPPPRIEVHQNPAFEDDEGIAESGV